MWLTKMAAKGMVKHVVLDSGAFLRNAPVQEIAESAYTIPDVVEEIRDKATKQRLEVLPYQLQYREPSAESLRAVTDFAKKTGDYRSLSAVDIRVMALCYQLEKEFVGVAHLKTVPDRKIEWNASRKPLQKATEIAGFYVKSKKSSSRTTSECSVGINHGEARLDEVSETTQDSLNERVQDPAETKLATVAPSSVESSTVTVTTDESSDVRLTGNETGDKCEDTIPIESEDLKAVQSKNTQGILQTQKTQPLSEDLVATGDKAEGHLEGEIIQADCIEEDFESGSEEDSDDDDDDDEGWITPSNIKEVKGKMGDVEEENAEVAVGCLTTDFSMQNVLIQMGLNVISVDGLLIKKAKSFVLRCSACMKITTDVQKLFCPHCGNKSLTKVSMTINDDGSIRYFLSRRRPDNTRGLKYSLPAPKGGKHAVNPYLVEDQPQAHNRVGKKAQQKLDVLNPDYMANASPFGMKDVTSRAAYLGITAHRSQWDRRNQNEWKRKGKK